MFLQELSNQRVVFKSPRDMPFGAHIQWVTSYKLQYSDDGVNFQYCRGQGQNIDKVKTFYFVKSLVYKLELTSLHNKINIDFS